MQPDSPLDIVNDAKLVASHGARSGDLKSDHAIFGSIAAADALGNGLTWGSPEFAALQGALSDAVRAIRPVMLHDLKQDGWRIDRDAPIPLLRRGMRWVVIAATIIVVIVCSLLTVWQQSADVVLGEFAKGKIRELNKEVEELVLLIEGVDDQEDVFSSLGDPSSAMRSALRNKYDTILALEKSLERDEADLSRLLHEEPVRATLEWAGAKGRDVLFAAAALIATSSTAQTEEILPTVEPETEATKAEAAACVYPDPDGAHWEDLFQPPQRAIRLFHNVVQHDRQYAEWLRCKTKLSLVHTFMAVPSEVGRMDASVADLKRELVTWHAWLLPALYGTLGALIYHVRLYLSRSRPDPTVPKVLMRVLLGGFAGVAISWFWPDDSGSAFLGFTELQLTLLTLAFMVGFAIDVFWALLDRLVTVIDGKVRSIGQPSR